jgi:hypothetical protein
MKDCVEKVEALKGLESQIEHLAKELQSKIDKKQTFATDIYKALYPIFDQRINAIQEETIKELAQAAHLIP